MCEFAGPARYAGASREHEEELQGTTMAAMHWKPPDTQAGQGGNPLLVVIS